MGAIKTQNPRHIHHGIKFAITIYTRLHTVVHLLFITDIKRIGRSLSPHTNNSCHHIIKRLLINIGTKNTGTLGSQAFSGATADT